MGWFILFSDKQRGINFFAQMFVLLSAGRCQELNVWETCNIGVHNYQAFPVAQPHLQSEGGSIQTCGFNDFRQLNN